MQDQIKILPQFLNTDVSFEKMNPDESPFIKGLSNNLNGNPENGNGQNTPIGEGGNILSLTPTRSNIAIPNTLLPQGYNKNCGQFESVNTQELYYFNYNVSGNHGIYVLDGNTGVWTKIIEDPQLGFTDNQENYIAQHRCTLRVVYDENRRPTEKILMFTLGVGWQKWINTIAAIKTNGFDANQYPYWTLQPPHFDRRELLEHAVRPPMFPITVTALTPDPSTYGNANLIVDQAFKFAFSYVYTDGRETTVSPFSLPLIVKSDDYNFQLSLTPQQANLVLYAGSPMLEYIRLYIQKNNGDWYLYDTIYKYVDCNAEDQLITDYWLRTNPFSGFNYDEVFNTLTYTFSNDRQYQIIDQPTFDREETDMPISSVALSDLKDEVLYANNKYGYDNLDCSVTSKFSVEAVEGSIVGCQINYRNVNLYAYILNQDTSNSQPVMAFNQTYIFGGVNLVRVSNGTYFGTIGVNVNTNNITAANLYVSNGSFVCYLNGTPYYALGKLYVADNLQNLTVVDHELDATNADDLAFVQTILQSDGSYFVLKFEFVVPAGIYTACIGRHDELVTGNYRGLSTYVLGITNNNKIYQKGVPAGFGMQGSYEPSVITQQSKQLYIDCTGSDIDFWTLPSNTGNIFTILAPANGSGLNPNQKWIEGYFYESSINVIPIEQYQYLNTQGLSQEFNFGAFTDSNGFFFGNPGGNQVSSAEFNIFGNLNCTYIPYTTGNSLINLIADTVSPNGLGFYTGINVYLDNHNGSVVGDCNRIILRGTIKSLQGVGLSNISVTIIDGMTTLTQVDGSFELIVHNGLINKRISPVIINANGKYTLFSQNCGVTPPFQFNENNAPCVDCNVREIDNFINLSAQVVGSNTVFSVKQNAQYTASITGYDLAGRETFANEISNISVSSFLQRQDTLPMHFEWSLAAGLDLRTEQSTQDLAYLSFSVTKNITYERYIQWVGDKITFINADGTTITDTGLAAFAVISIDSLLQANIQSNFTLDATYQFTQGDRLRIYDDGTNLLPISPLNLPIDLQIEGTSYNQAAINSNVLPPDVNTVLNNNPTVDPSNIVILYDPRLDQLINKVGFWIEIYTPIAKVTKEILFFETNFYAIINGTIAVFTGYDGTGAPTYNYLTSDIINYWDTYLYGRYINIPLTGDSSFYHNFESPNVSDKWGIGITSGGRTNTIDEYAEQMWYEVDTIRSDVFISTGSKNGLGTFREVNSKSFDGYWRGGIVSIKAINSMAIIIFENDYCTVTYNYHYVSINEQGQATANLDSGFSEPHLKVGMVFGCSYEDTATIIFEDKIAGWYDRKNEGFILSDYQSATDISDITDADGRKYGIKSYIIKKTQAINQWNAANPNEKRFDVVAGIDVVRKNVIISFRPRRNNSNNPLSYINNRRNIDLKTGETIVYNLDSKRWTKFESYVAEGYANLRGNSSGVEFISFAAGQPYIHNQSGNTSYLNFFGVQTEPVITGIFNKQPDIVKILQSVSVDNVNNNMFIDMIYDNEQNSFSYIPFNRFNQKEKFSYAGVLRDMVSYLVPDIDKPFRSTLQDGKRMFGRYFVIRFVGQVDTLNNYFQLNSMNCLITNGHTTKP